MPEFILKDRYGKKQTFDHNKIFVMDPQGGLIQFTQGEGDVPAVLQEKEITENGEYTADEGYDGLRKVTVNIPAPEITMQDKTITENGIYTADSGYDGLGSVTVAVAGSGDGNADVCYVTFMSDDGTVVYGRKAVAVGDDCANPITRGVFNTPVKESSESLDYRFVNWADEMGGAVNTAWNKAITEDKIVYAVFEACGGSCGESVTWYISADHKTLTISGTGAMNGNYVNYGTNTPPWKPYWSYIKTVNMSSEITNIGKFAFYGCTALTSFTVPASVTSIGKDAFNGCTSLTSFTIPATVTSFGERLFVGCSSLKTVTVNCVMTTVPQMMFQDCTALTSFNIQDGVTFIGSGAFCRCYALSSITIPASVTFIGNSAFYDCTKLTSATFKSTTGWSAGSHTLSSSSLSSKSTAATYLKSTYAWYEWTHS